MLMKPKRRWFRFSLRTLFVVMTLVAVWLGWQASIVRERQALLAEEYDQRYSWWPQKDMRTWWSVRELMGDCTFGAIVVPVDAPPDRIARIKHVFSEAEVFVWDVPFRASGFGDAALSKAIADSNDEASTDE